MVHVINPFLLQPYVNTIIDIGDQNAYYVIETFTVKHYVENIIGNVPYYIIFQRNVNVTSVIKRSMLTISVYFISKKNTNSRV